MRIIFLIWIGRSFLGITVSKANTNKVISFFFVNNYCIDRTAYASNSQLFSLKTPFPSWNVLRIPKSFGLYELYLLIFTFFRNYKFILHYLKKKPLHINKHILCKNSCIFQNENSCEKIGPVLHFCKSVASPNRRQLDFHIYFCIQYAVMWYVLTPVYKENLGPQIWCWKKEEHLNGLFR